MYHVAELCVFILHSNWCSVLCLIIFDVFIHYNILYFTPFSIPRIHCVWYLLRREIAIPPRERFQFRPAVCVVSCVFYVNHGETLFDSGYMHYM